MDDIEIEFDFDEPDPAGPQMSRHDQPWISRVRRDWLSAGAFVLAAGLLVAAPFLRVYSTSALGGSHEDGWGRFTARPDPGLTITYIGPRFGVVLIVLA